MKRFSGSSAQLLLALIGVVALLLVAHASAPTVASDTAMDVIVQATDVSTAAHIVARYNGTVTRELPIINSVVARVDTETLARLRSDTHVSAVWHNKQVEVASKPANWRKEIALEPGHYASVASDVVDIHKEGITGDNVTVAIVDSGFPFTPLLNPRQAGRPRGAPRDGSLYFRRWFTDQFILYKDFVDPRARHSKDPFGHGTHVAGSIIGARPVALDEDSDETASLGVAPGANLVVARAIGEDGSGTYADVIEAIGWIVEMREYYGVDVLNMSLHASVEGPYWLDPMNQAVMKAWEAGITVVAAAGNDGPEPSSVRAPGNVPYVITVGSYREAEYSDSGNTELLDFSSRGPTESRFVKPDVLMPGYKIVAPMPKRSYLAEQIGESTENESGSRLFDGVLSRIGYYPLSGTSMSTAQTSGVVALMLQRDPGLSNNEVKARLMETASIAFDETTNRAVYSVWEQGAGQVNSYEAVFSNTDSVANEGLDVSADLDTGPDGVHYLGFTGLEKDTNAFVIGEQTDPAGYFRWTGDNDVDSSGNWVWTGGNWVWTGGNWVWTGNQFVETGGNWVWTGGNWVWTGGNWVWTGGNWVWTGGNWVWTGNEPVDEHGVELGIMPAQ